MSEGAGFDWAANIISLGALVAITSVVLTLLYGQSRILFAMSRDGLMPKRVGKVNQRTRTPVFIIGACGVVFSILAALVPLAEIVKLVNIGTLFAFIVVNAGVMILRRTSPDMERGYRVPFVPLFPIIGIAALRLPGAGPRARDVAAVPQLDGDRPRHLLPLRLPPLAPAPGRGRRPRGRAARRR